MSVPFGKGAGADESRLAICVPTRNRARLLRALLEALRAQVDERDVAIVVSDNASTDDTILMLSMLAASGLRVRWVQSDENLGPDRNFLRAVEASDAEFCWLFGSDDLPVEGSVDKVLAELDRTEADVLLVGRYWCSYDMEPIRRDALFEPDVPTVFDTATETGLALYLDRATSICSLFSYLSSIVVRKSRWEGAGSVEPFVGSAYSHSAKLLAIVAAGAKVAYVPGPLVYCRGDNDHFLEHGAFNRCRIDFVGFGRLIDTYLTDEPFNGLARRVMRREYTLPRLLLVVSIATGVECRELRGFLRDFGYPGWTRVVVTLSGWRPVHAIWRRLAPALRRIWWWRQRRSFSTTGGSAAPAVDQS